MGTKGATVVAAPQDVWVGARKGGRGSEHHTAPTANTNVHVLSLARR